MTDNTSKYQVEGWLLALGCFVAYWLSFRLNVLLNPWVEIMPGVALVFLPAGVKLVSILVADKWGLIGVGAAGLWMAADVWTAAELLPLIGNIAVWLGVPYAIIKLMMWYLDVDGDLRNISYLNLLQIIATAAFTQALTTNTYAIFFHGRDPRDLLYGTVGMMLGDFVGSGLMLALMLAGVTLWQRFRDKT